MLADSAATGHFFHSSALLTNVRPGTPSTRIAVKGFNDKIIHSSHIGELNIPSLPAAARIAHVFPGISDLLVSISQLCNAGCMATF